MLNFSLEKFREWTQQIRSGDDVAIVYYTGPRILTREGAVAAKNNAGFADTKIKDASDMEEILTKRNPRLAVVCFDCYENLLPASGRKTHLAKAVCKKQIEKYANVFKTCS